MAGYEISVGRGFVARAVERAGRAGKKLVEAVLNQILEAQVAETLGAERHGDRRQAGHRNGCIRARSTPRVGPVTCAWSGCLRLPQGA